jgi:hypothetical protein
MKPTRIQRKREKGWRKPENTVCVTRPGKWGNPFRVIGSSIYIHAGHRLPDSPWVYCCEGDAEKAVMFFRAVVTGIFPPGEYGVNIASLPDFSYHAVRFAQLDLSELRNKNIACFCPIGSPCHGDVYIELANI